MELTTRDTFGQSVRTNYRIITDPTFERRLKAVDKNLRLMFDHGSERWVILEAALDGSGWNVILKGEDREGNPKPLGDWVFTKLWVMRKNHEAKREMGADKWLDGLRLQAEEWKRKEEEKIRDDSRTRLREDVLQWRKVANEMDGKPANDAVAGFAKREG